MWSSLPIGLPEEIARKFVTPEATGDDMRLVVRRMVRCGLATSLPAECVSSCVVRRECLLLRRILHETD